VTQAETLAVDSEGVDLVQHSEALFDQVQGKGLVNTAQTVVNDQTGDAVLKTSEGLHEAEESDGGESAGDAKDEA